MTPLSRLLQPPYLMLPLGLSKVLGLSDDLSLSRPHPESGDAGTSAIDGFQPCMSSSCFQLPRAKLSRVDASTQDIHCRYARALYNSFYYLAPMAPVQPLKGQHINAGLVAAEWSVSPKEGTILQQQTSKSRSIAQKSYYHHFGLQRTANRLLR